MGYLRYPGPYQFDLNQQDLFFGRKTETDKLYTCIQANHLVVLTAESGMGKSSLVNAGLLPEIAKDSSYGLVPVIIRFEGVQKGADKNIELKDSSSNALIKEVLACIKPHIGKTTSSNPYLLKNEDDLWYWNKLMQETGKTFLLIFDQFEITGFYTPEQVKEFKKSIAAITGSSIPDDYYNYLKQQSPVLNGGGTEGMSEDERNAYNEAVEELKRPLNTRVLFIVQEDKLNVVSRMRDYLPGILQASQELKLLDGDSAKDAIVSPGLVEGEFDSPRISFDEVLTKLKMQLDEKNTGYFDPLEIQIVCSFLEKQIIHDLTKAGVLETIRRKEEPGNYLDTLKIEELKEKGLEINWEKSLVDVKDKYVPPFKNIVESFYEQCWEQVKLDGKKTDEIEKMRKELLDEMVEGGVRLPVYSGTLSDDKQKILVILKEAKLLKPISVVNSDAPFYQLCHNRFIRPAEEDKKKLKDKQDLKRKKTKRLIKTGIAALFLAGLFIVIFGFIITVRANRYRQEKVLNNVTMLQRNGNPTLAYLLVKQWQGNQTFTHLVKDELAAINNTKQLYISDIAVLEDQLTEVEYTPEKNSLDIHTTADSFYSFNLSTQQSVSTTPSKSKFSEFVAVKPGPSSKLYYEKYYGFANYIDLYDSSLNVVGHLKLKGFFDYPEDIVASADGKYLLFRQYLYKRNGQKIGKKEILDIKKSLDYKNEYASTDTSDYNTTPLKTLFIDSGRYVAGIYPDGRIWVFNIAGKTQSESPRCINLYSNNSIKDEKQIFTMDHKMKNLFLATDNKCTVYSIENIIKSFQKEEIFPKPVSIELNAEISSLVFAKGDSLFSTGSIDGSVILWNLNTFQKKSVHSFNSGISNLWFRSNNTLIAQTEDNIAYLMNYGYGDSLYKGGKIYPFTEFDYQYWAPSVQYQTAAPKLKNEEFEYASVARYMASLRQLKRKESLNLEDTAIIGRGMRYISEKFWNLVSPWSTSSAEPLQQNKHRLIQLYSTIFSPQYNYDLVTVENNSNMEAYIDYYRREGKKLWQLDDKLIDDDNSISEAIFRYAFIQLDTLNNLTKTMEYLNFWKDTVYPIQQSNAKEGALDVIGLEYFYMQSTWYNIKKNDVAKINDIIKEIENNNTTRFTKDKIVNFLKFIYATATKKYDEAKSYYPRVVSNALFYRYGMYGYQILREIERKGDTTDHFNTIFQPFIQYENH